MEDAVKLPFGYQVVKQTVDHEACVMEVTLLVDKQVLAKTVRTELLRAARRSPVKLSDWDEYKA